jgi:hypothetical protein
VEAYNHSRSPWRPIITVVVRGGLQGFEMLRISDCLDIRLTDGGEVVTSCTGHAQIPRNIFISVSGTHLC